MSIFQKAVINQYLLNLDNKKLEKSYQTFQENYSLVKIDKIKKLKEEEYQDGFLRDIFVNVLGYTLKPDNNFNLVREFKNQSDSKKADGAILKNNKAKAVIELKSTKTKDLQTVTEQAFNYKNNQSDCKYVITSNFQKLRFYIDYSNEYEEFNLFRLDEQNFKLMFLILNKDSILNDIPEKIKKESVSHEEKISKQLYKDYSVFRKKLFENLIIKNLKVDKLTLFNKSQKLIDRFLFILFAEDKGLLPPNSINRIIERFNILKEEDAYNPLYEIYKQYFGYMNIGRKGKKIIDDIPAYNGGLFYPDKTLDSLKIDDEILNNDLQKLSAYDFDTEVDVNILGHIFEHSLSEIEKTTAQIKGINIDKAKSKRKKDGVFYTPQYITQYIVENTIGTLCQEKRKEFDIKEIEIDDRYYTKTGRLSKRGKELEQKLENYKNWLLSLKIIDPACGSGAFLNQALNFLIKEHNFIIEIRTDLNKGQILLFNVEKAVLENNLYGVDINKESVEITKLSLWLRTAHRERKLSNLSSNIKCGNSLIDDPEVAGDKAFKWEDEFPEIMKNGGFDVVIGNPPYTYRNAISKKEKEYFQYSYQSIEGNFDLYKLFLEKIVRLNKNRGYSSFIIPNTFLTAKTYTKLRKILIENFAILEFFDLGLDVFKNVVVESIILKLKKMSTKNQITKIKIQHDRNRSFENLQKNYVIDLLKYSGDKFLFNTNISTQVSSIIDRMLFGTVFLENICYCTVGINTGYIKNELTAEKKIDFRYHKMLNGKNIGKNFVRWNNEWIMYDVDFVKSKGNKGRTLPPEYIFSNEKILVQRTRRGMKRKLVCYYDNEQYYNLNRLSNIILTDQHYSLKYIYLLLNSVLMDFFFNKFFNEYEVKPLHLAKLPIKYTKNQRPFIEKTDIMLSKNKELHNLKDDFINFFKSELNPQKINKKLTNWNELEFEEFKKELAKCKVKFKDLNLKERKEWKDYFTEQKQEADRIKSVIDNTDKEIDKMVYELYGLTQEEIEIIENAP